MNNIFKLARKFKLQKTAQAPSFQYTDVDYTPIINDVKNSVPFKSLLTMAQKILPESKIVQADFDIKVYHDGATIKSVSIDGVNLTSYDVDASDKINQFVSQDATMQGFLAQLKPILMGSINKNKSMFLKDVKGSGNQNPHSLPLKIKL